MNQLLSLSNTKQKKRTIAIAIACSFLLVLPSCIPNLRHPAPGPNLPESFNLHQADSGPDLPEVFEATSSENSAEVKIEEFFDDPMLMSLIHQALVNNQELRILNEDVLIASYEILARQGAYLPFVTAGGGVSLNRFSQYTPEGAGIRDDPFLPGKFLPNPLPNYILGPAFFWTPDIWRQLHNAKDAAAMRYFATGEGRNYFVTQLVAEIADNYYGLIALDKRLENLDNIIALQEQSLRFAQAAKEAARGTELAVQRFLAEVRKNQSEKLIVKQDIIQVENRINFLVGRFPQPVERLDWGIHRSIHRSEIAYAWRRSALAATSEPTRHPPSRARDCGSGARREGRPETLLSCDDHHLRRWLRGFQPKVSVHYSRSPRCQCRW